MGGRMCVIRRCRCGNYGTLIPVFLSWVDVPACLHYCSIHAIGVESLLDATYELSEGFWDIPYSEAHRAMVCVDALNFYIPPRWRTYVEPLIDQLARWYARLCRQKDGLNAKHISLGIGRSRPMQGWRIIQLQGKKRLFYFQIKHLHFSFFPSKPERPIRNDFLSALENCYAPFKR